jgi:hypothetical protein
MFINVLNADKFINLLLVVWNEMNENYTSRLRKQFALLLFWYHPYTYQP